MPLPILISILTPMLVTVFLPPSSFHRLPSTLFPYLINFIQPSKSNPRVARYLPLSNSTIQPSASVYTLLSRLPFALFRASFIVALHTTIGILCLPVVGAEQCLRVSGFSLAALLFPHFSFHPRPLSSYSTYPPGLFLRSFYVRAHLQSLSSYFDNSYIVYNARSLWFISLFTSFPLLSSFLSPSRYLRRLSMQSLRYSPPHRLFKEKLGL